MKKELTLEDFSIKNGEEYQNFLGKLGRKKGRANVAPIPPPLPATPVLLKQPSVADIKMDSTCRKSLFKNTKKCKEYFQQKLRKEQETARLTAEAAAKEAAQQKSALTDLQEAIIKAKTESQAQEARENLKLVKELSDLRENQAVIAKNRADQLGVLQQELRQSSGAEISNNQADLINKILNESTLDKMKQAVSESPLLNKLPTNIQAQMTTTSNEAEDTKTETQTETEEKEEAVVTSGTASEPTTSGVPAAGSKKNMLIYGAIGVGVLLLLFGKKIFGSKSAA